MPRRIKTLVSGLCLLVVAACGTKSAHMESGSASHPAAQAVPPVGKIPSPPAPIADPLEGTHPESTPLAASESALHEVPRGSTCGLRSTLRSLGHKDGVEEYSLTLTNTGSQAVQLVVPGDGSQVGWRTPVLTWAAKSEGKPIAELAPARCGMMNAIEASEIFTLAPGKSRTLVDWLGSPSYPAGTYDLEIRYRNAPSLAENRAPVAPEVAAKLASTSACDVTSNPLRVTFK